MPNRNPPKSYPGMPSSPTLADLAREIGRDTSIWKRRRDGIVDGLHSVASVVGKPMRDLPAMPEALAVCLRASRAWRTDINGAERDRLRKLTRAAVERAGLARVPGRYGEPLSRRWIALLSLLGSPTQRLALFPLCRFASRSDIPPGAVDDGVLDDFLSAMHEDSLLKDVRNIHRLACKAWNLACATVPGWPRRTVTVPDYRDVYQLPWRAFPASLKADLDRYLEGASENIPLTDATYGPWSRVTARNTGKLLHSYVSATVRGGTEPGSLRSLADLVTADAVRKGLVFLLTRSDGRISVQTGHVALAVAHVARNWVGVDDDRQAELDALCKRVTPPRSGLSDGHRLLLRQFDAASSVSAVLDLPRRLVAEADASAASAAARARMVQTALLVELLAVVPIRVGELARLDVADFPSGSGRERARLVFQRLGRGSPVLVDFPLPESTRCLLRTYLCKHRPVLAPAGCRAMFPGRSGTAKTDQIIRGQVSTAVTEFTGLKLTPNLFRHFAAKHFLDRNPGEFGVVRFILGHRSLQTTSDKYSEMDGPAAFRSVDRVVLGAKPTRPRHGSRDGRARLPGRV